MIVKNSLVPLFNDQLQNTNDRLIIACLWEHDGACFISSGWAVSPFVVAVFMYRKTSNISRTLVGNKIVDHSDVVGASPVGAAPTSSSFST